MILPLNALSAQMVPCVQMEESVHYKMLASFAHLVQASKEHGHLRMEDTIWWGVLWGALLQMTVLLHSIAFSVLQSPTQCRPTTTVVLAHVYHVNATSALQA